MLEECCLVWFDSFVKKTPYKLNPIRRNQGKFWSPPPRKSTLSWYGLRKTLSKPLTISRPSMNTNLVTDFFQSVVGALQMNEYRKNEYSILTSWQLKKQPTFNIQIFNIEYWKSQFSMCSWEDYLLRSYKTRIARS